MPREVRLQLSQQKRNYARYAFGNLSVGVQYALQAYLLQSSFIHAQTTFLLRIWNTSLPIQLRSGQNGWTQRASMLRAQNMTTRNWYLRLKHFLQSFGGPEQLIAINLLSYYMNIHRLFQLRRYLTKLQDSNKKWIHAIIWCIIPEPKVFPNKYCITFIRTIQMILVKDYLVLLAE